MRTAERGVKDGVQAVRANRRMGFTPAVPPRSRERPKSAHRVEPAEILPAPYRTSHVRAKRPLRQLRRAAMHMVVRTREGEVSLLMTGRLVGLTKFACSIPKASVRIHSY